VYSVTHSLTSPLDGGQLPAPADLPPGKERRYPLNRILVGHSFGVDNLEKTLLPLVGFERQIAQPVRQSLHRLHYPSSPSALIKSEDKESKKKTPANLFYDPPSIFLANYRSKNRFTTYVMQEPTHLFSLSNYSRDVR